MRIIIMLAFVLATVSGTFAADPVEAKSDITDVTVYRRGAQVTRESKVVLKTGKNEIVFSGLAKNIDKRTIQASAPPEVVIISVSHEVNYLKEQSLSPRVKRLNDSLEVLADQLEDEQYRKTVLDKELAMVLANQDLKGNEKGLNAQELEAAANFFRRRLDDIYSKQLSNKRKQEDLNKEISRLRLQLKELNYKANQPSNDIVVIVESQRPKTIEMGIRYFVQDAGWAPTYDLRAKNTTDPIQLSYRAEVWQQSGIDWKNVMLTLSTGNPNQGGTKPELGIWNLAIYDPVLYDYKAKGRGDMNRMVEKKAAAPATSADDGWGDDGGSDDWGEVEEEPAFEFGQESSLALFTEVEEGATMAEFKISIEQDVLSGEKPQQVTIQNSELPAMYQHFAVPKLDPDAFLLARVTEWEQLNLLPGKVNIFFEGTYITQAFLDTDFSKDTLDFSLGRDKKVVIDRTQLKDFNRTKTIGFNRERTFGYEIVVRNTKREKVSLHLEEQIPISQDKDIEVKIEEQSNGKINEDTGKIHWDLELMPEEVQKIRLVFKVKYPKNKDVSGW